MRLLLDEMHAPAIAQQLRARGHNVASVHDPEYRTLEGEPDEEVWAAALAADRVLVTENALLRHAAPVMLTTTAALAWIGSL